jgi:hypothetical protein
MTVKLEMNIVFLESTISFHSDKKENSIKRTTMRELRICKNKKIKLNIYASFEKKRFFLSIFHSCKKENQYQISFQFVYLFMEK